ncbi:MAG: glycosyltransferase family 2 protein [Candidatus Aminicenantes bacterium]|nr:glycosyltransferase family 2 protein [Candidatus Aminicenantes bacterium]
MANKLSVLIPCKDEEKNISFCIESVLSIADEIVVADSGSTDRTMEIAREYECRIIEREYINSANFKNWAIPQATHDWILIIDSDERVSPELAAEISETLEKNTPEYDGYFINRRNYLFGKLVKRSGWGTDYVLRLFKRDMAKYKEMRVHSEIVISSGKVGKLREKFEHYTYWNYFQIMKKYEMYTTWAAEDMRDKGVKPSFLNLTFTPSWRFFRHYILQRGFLDGKAGLIVSGLSMYYVFLKYAKLWKMTRTEKRPSPPDIKEMKSRYSRLKKGWKNK